jgi:hypothetical protein
MILKVITKSLCIPTSFDISHHRHQGKFTLQAGTPPVKGLEVQDVLTFEDGIDSF